MPVAGLARRRFLVGLGGVTAAAACRSPAVPKSAAIFNTEDEIDRTLEAIG